jgi:hypothetical protein
MQVWYWISLSLRAFSKPLRRALAKLLRSMKFRMNRRIRVGKMRMSILRTRAFSCASVQAGRFLSDVVVVKVGFVSLYSIVGSMVSDSQIPMWKSLLGTGEGDELGSVQVKRSAHPNN